MKKIGVLGSREFVLGFELAGVKHVFETTAEAIGEQARLLMGEKQVGIVVVDQRLLNTLDKHDRMEIESSVNPVFVPLSTDSKQDNLRFLIKKSIGVDVMA